MRTSLLLAALVAAGPALAGTPAGDAMRFTVGVPAEVSLVGLAVGVRPELLYRPAAPDGWFHLRAAVGVLPGWELTNLPVSVGVRAVAAPRRIVRPHLGLGAQLQLFIPYGAPVRPRLDVYLEAGLDVRVAAQWRVGLDLNTEFGMAAAFGLGGSVRLGFRYDFAPPRTAEQAKAARLARRADEAGGGD